MPTLFGADWKGAFMNNNIGGAFYLDPYDRERAVEYALRWAKGRNVLFEDFTGGGGDCTNFVSQAIYAGCCQMNFTETFGWYFRSVNDRSPSWTGVEAFYDFMTGSGDFAPVVTRSGPFGYLADVSEVEEGDVVQLADESGDFYHTLIITGFDGDEILVSAHSNDALDRPLSSYMNSSERFIKILGVARQINEPKLDCFERLIENAPDEL